MRPLFFADPRDPALRDETSAFLLGADLMVVSRIAEDASDRPALPKGIWRPLTLVGESPRDDINHPELRIRGGAIIPAGRVVENTHEKMLNPLTLFVSLDADGQASGVLYEDAGDGYGYQQGEYLLTQYQASLSAGVVTVEVHATEGKLTRPERKVAVEVITDSGVTKGEGTEKEPIKIKL
jgi:alpha-glucosidase